MINKDLKRLSRRELVDIIYQLKKNEQQLQEKIDVLEAQLNDRRIRISAAGSVADAAVDITGILSNAQTTADLYLEEISSMKQDTEKECESMIEAAKKKVEEIMDDAQRRYDSLVERYEADYKKWQKVRAELQKSDQD